MKMFVVFVILLHVSQHALAEVVEVYKEATSVLLPCQYSGVIPEKNPTVMWTHNNLDPKSVHLRLKEGDDLKEQNQRYSRRTSMMSDALETGDFSLTLRKPELSDSGTYTCSISDGRKELGQRKTQLKVKDQQVEMKVEKRSESVILPCKTKPYLPEDTRVEWTRSDLGLMLVHEYSNRSDQLRKQDNLYCGRTKMNEDLLRTGDLSLTLKQPTERDTGGYICTIYRDKDILRQKVVLQVKEPFPSWATGLLVLLALLVLLITAVLLFHFRQYTRSVSQHALAVVVEVYEGETSVLLHYVYKGSIPEDNPTVMWTRSDLNPKSVHLQGKGGDDLKGQNQRYSGRTSMSRYALNTKDFSLTLRKPKLTDSGIYTCSISAGGGEQRLSDIQLQVKDHHVEVKVEEGSESVTLPCKTTPDLPENTRVEWTRSDHEHLIVQEYSNKGGKLMKQDKFYRDRTEMNEDLLKTSV